MIIDMNQIASDIDELRKYVEEKMLTPPQKTMDQEVNEEMNNPQYNQQKIDAKFLVKCFKYLKKLGYIKTQYEFSEQFLGKNKYYFGMILSEQRHPSFDAIHHLITGISQINDGLNKLKHLDNLYEEGQGLITKRLLKYF
jgi:hypothetical protein